MHVSTLDVFIDKILINLDLIQIVSFVNLVAGTFPYDLKLHYIIY